MFNYLFPIFATALILSSLPTKAASAQDPLLNACLQAEVIKETNLNKTVKDLTELCHQAVAPTISEDSEAQKHKPSIAADAPGHFFQPYKRNYIVFGSMKNNNGGQPFSGKTFDIKFELGMQFALFPDEESPLLAPLRFGYSQRSWWDIAESSAPFKEHNYNPEIFWDFTQTNNTRNNRASLHLVDQFGFEHQSNGLDQQQSRSWDRLYAKRSFYISEALSWSLKAWKIVDKGDFNTDIDDYLGHLEIGAQYTINNWAKLELSARQGNNTSKISYQADLVVPISRWINSHFMLSFYDGYGEALISHNYKTRSLRAGFYFPLGF
ncbi:MAG: phospholipase A [Pseudohongiellaceae bacterium]|nr:phospholipase A [Pseudohongiellaceae bacterium]